MPTLKDQILEFLADRPGKTDREITNAIKGRSAAPQGVNQVQWGLWCECASGLIQTHNLPNFVMVIDCRSRGQTMLNLDGVVSCPSQEPHPP